MFILPLGHEHMQAQRFPHITLGIIILNAFFYLVTLFAMPPTERAHREAEGQLIEFYLFHLDMKLPERVYEKLQPESRRFLKQAQETGLSDVLQQFNLSPADFHQEKESGDSDPNAQAIKRQQDERKFAEYIRAFEFAYQNDFYNKYGYVPARGEFMTIFSSIFLHGGFFHLLFNMLFLWLSGCNIEDLWGRVIYPIFYLLGGVVATLAHGLMSHGSSVPLIGASGAIAAVMGAFMIRMYSTKIYFVYIIFFYGIKRGRFDAPAFVMLPLWLLQQFWGVMTEGGGEGGVAFWAHIGGFIFGAAVALLLKVSGLETKVIAPAIEKKTAVVDEHLGDGLEKLQAGDFAGAVAELKIAAANEPDNPTAQSELARAYFKNGQKDLAQRQFKRVILLHIKQGNMANAVDQFVELQQDMPGMMLDAPQQKKLAVALEERAKTLAQQASDPKAAEQGRAFFAHAASAYKQIAAHFQKQAGNFEHADAAAALRRYAELQLTALNNPAEAGKAYAALLKNTTLSPEERAAIEAKIQQARQACAAQADRANIEQAERQKQAAEAQKIAQERGRRAALLEKILMAKRVKILPLTDAPAKYLVPSVAPLEANKVLPVDGGLDLKIPAEPPLRFEDIFLICVFQLPEMKATIDAGTRRHKGTKDAAPGFDSVKDVLFADLFMRGRSRPFRLASNHIPYTQFFSELHGNSFDNFRQFLLNMIAQIESVYVDQHAANFLKSGKMSRFSSVEELDIYEKRLWKQLRGAARAVCQACAAAYWLDGNKIPAAGGKMKCAACGSVIAIPKPDAQKDA